MSVFINLSCISCQCVQNVRFAVRLDKDVPLRNSRKPSCSCFFIGCKKITKGIFHFANVKLFHANYSMHVVTLHFQSTQMLALL